MPGADQKCLAVVDMTKQRLGFRRHFVQRHHGVFGVIGMDRPRAQVLDQIPVCLAASLIDRRSASDARSAARKHASPEIL
jgi:hypothetical protein